jgi:hypothetical protein
VLRLFRKPCYCYIFSIACIFEVILFMEMHSLVSIVCVVLSGKENYLEWSRKIEHTLIFNDLWDDICDGDTAPTKHTR